MKDHLTKIEAT